MSFSRPGWRDREGAAGADRLAIGRADSCQLRPVKPGPQSSTALRTRLIEAAVELLVAGGWPSLSIRRLAAATGMCRTDINDIFPKRKLIAALTDHAIVEIMIVARHPDGACPNLTVARARLALDRKGDPEATRLMGLVAIEARLPVGPYAPWMGIYFDERLRETAASLAALCGASESATMAVLDEHIACAAGMTATTRRMLHNSQRG